jgi:hypothetical protein
MGCAWPAVVPAFERTRSGFLGFFAVRRHRTCVLGVLVGMSMTSELKDQALRVAGSVDPDLMTGSQAADAVEDLAVADKAVAGTLLFLALRVAKTNAWQGRGFKTAAEWLASVAGISVSEAARHLGTARRAEDLPKTKDAMKQGKISPDQAEPVADAATADPTAEQDLLDLAERDTNKNLKDEAAKRKAAVTDTETRDRRIHRERSKRTWIDRDGAWNLHLRGTAADGARFDEQNRPYEEQAFRTGRTDGVRDSFENRGYDAVMALLGIRPLHSGSAVEPAAPVPAPAKVPGGANTKVIVRIDHTALLRGRTVAGETCEVAGLGPISVNAAKDLMGDAFLAAVITKGHDVVNVAHLGRGPNAYQRTALQATGTACTNIGCNRTVNVQVDHRVPYAANPETKLGNLDPLCAGAGSCHHLKTHEGHELEAGTGRRRLLPPDHPDHPKNRARTGDTGPPQVEQTTLC